MGGRGLATTSASNASHHRLRPRVWGDSDYWCWLTLSVWGKVGNFSSWGWFPEGLVPGGVGSGRGSQAALDGVVNPPFEPCYSFW